MRRLSLDAAYSEVSDGVFRAGKLTRGPWHPDHQHAGPPSALICRAIERVAAKDGLTHLGRLTVNLLRPAPIGECRVEVAADYTGRNAGHFSGRLTAQDKDVARFTALMQREEDSPIPKGTPGSSAASGSEAARPKPGRRDSCGGAEEWLRQSGGKSDCGGTLLQRTLRRLVSHEPSAR